MNVANDMTLSMDELAGYWTEPALKMLKAAGIERISVEMEVEAWRMLKRVLRGKMRWQVWFRSSRPVSLSMLMRHTLRTAVFWVARKFEPQSVSFDFQNRIDQWVGQRQATAAERALFTRIVRGPVAGPTHEHEKGHPQIAAVQLVSAGGG
jgi:hypothetical protein